VVCRLKMSQGPDGCPIDELVAKIMASGYARRSRADTEEMVRAVIEALVDEEALTVTDGIIDYFEW